MSPHLRLQHLRKAIVIILYYIYIRLKDLRGSTLTHHRLRLSLLAHSHLMCVSFPYFLCLKQTDYWSKTDVFFPLQDDKDPSSNRESLDDLFPADDEEQSQSKALMGCKMWV